jgi:nitroreductase
MELEQAITTRRTHKAYRPDPVAPEVLDELLAMADWAPTHHLRAPWRFRVVGPQALEDLKRVAGPANAPKLDRAPTLVAVSAALTGDPVADEEDLHAAACAAYIVLLVAHGRGLAGYWRTPGFMRGPEAAAAISLPGDERFVALLYLGHPIQDQEPPHRPPGSRAVRLP